MLLTSPPSWYTYTHEHTHTLPSYFCLYFFASLSPPFSLSLSLSISSFHFPSLSPSFIDSFFPVLVLVVFCSHTLARSLTLSLLSSQCLSLTHTHMYRHIHTLEYNIKMAPKVCKVIAHFFPAFLFPRFSTCKNNIHMHTDAYVCWIIYISIYIYIHIYIYIYTCTYTQIHKHIYIHMHIYEYNMYKYINTHVHIHTLSANI